MSDQRRRRWNQEEEIKKSKMNLRCRPWGNRMGNQRHGGECGLSVTSGVSQEEVQKKPQLGTTQ
jgi:hypothetical protein